MTATIHHLRPGLPHNFFITPPADIPDPEAVAHAAERAVAQPRQYIAWIRADAGPDVCRDALAGLEDLARRGDEAVRRLRVEGWGR